MKEVPARLFLFYYIVEKVLVFHWVLRNNYNNNNTTNPLFNQKHENV